MLISPTTSIKCVTNNVSLAIAENLAAISYVQNTILNFDVIPVRLKHLGREVVHICVSELGVKSSLDLARYWKRIA